ncbi:MAG: pyrroline-5-carboxylate reductase [Ruminococcaceae bacterium]|nr:pyrroline-5-carboxylate reductase [Oscillospiraceae bacterium]
MSQYTFGMIGCGNMGGALAQAAAKVLSSSKLAICESNPEKISQLRGEGFATVTGLSEIAKNSQFVILAVKPQGLANLFDELRQLLKDRTDRFVLVSMAAGVSIARIRELAGADYPIIRIMPNTPVRVEKGMVVYTAAGTTAEEENLFLKIFLHAGKFQAIDEKKIDAAGALSGCGPAFVYLFAEALADGGVECGLTRDEALLYAAQTLSGAAEMILQTGEHPAKLKDAVCSPGGTTIEGVYALEEGAFRGTVMSAVRAAFEKTAKLK